MQTNCSNKYTLPLDDGIRTDNGLLNNTVILDDNIIPDVCIRYGYRFP